MANQISGAQAAFSSTFEPEQDSAVNTSVYPYNTVVLLETTNPNSSQFFDGTGVIVGPHTILTASHMLWDSVTSSEADHVYIYPGYNSNGVPNPAGSGAALSTGAQWHNFQVGNRDGTISSSDSQFDYAVIDVSFTFSSWMGIQTDSGSGSAHLTGYPVTTNGFQDDQFGTFSLDPNFSLYQYGSIVSNHGNSGGPLWIDQDPSSAVLPYVIGIASSTSSATEITTAKFNQISTWVTQDGYSLSASTGLVSINDVSITEGNSGTKLATFTVTRTGGTGAFAISYSTSDGTATVADNDYLAKSGRLNFGTNVNTQTITVTINGDTKFESDETFFVNLSGATNGATVSDNQGIGTIVNDDIAVPTNGNDTLTDGPTNDVMDGLAGDDTVIFSGALGSYTLRDLGPKITVSGPDGNDTLLNVEHLRFSDGTINVNDGSAVFDTVFYDRTYLDVFHAGIDAHNHYKSNGWHEGRDPDPFFSTNLYLAANKDVKNAGVNPLDHYDQNGWKEGRDPGPNFDTTLYLIHNPDVKAAGIDPLAHYLQFGQAEGRQAYQAIGTDVNGFDAEYYLFHNPDVAAAGIDPLQHYN